MFKEKKFLSLSPKNRAKKISDLLRQVLLFTPADWKSELENYNQLCGFLDANEKKVDPQRLNQNELVDHYTYWRGLTGLGIEGDLYSALTQTDRETPNSPALPWQTFMHNLRSGHNVGSVIRSSDCFGLQGIITSGYTPGPDNKAVKSAAMGAEAWMPHQHWNNPLEQLKSQILPPPAEPQWSGCALVALETDPSAPTLKEFEWPKKGILLIGNEEFGLSDEFLDLATHRVQIPMYGRKNSLNVSNAFAVCAFALREYFESQKA